MRPRSSFSLTAIAEALDPRHALRSSEWVAIAYFSYTAIYTIFNGLDLPRIMAAWALPVLIWAGGLFESAHSKPTSRVCRALLPTALILVAYQQIDWFSGNSREQLQMTWAAWDRAILIQWRLQHVIELLGPTVPLLLDACYLLLYSVPPLCVIFLLASGRGDRVDRFLTPLLIGTFAAYALLPHFPSRAPRIAFPNDMLPNFETSLRKLNLFVLDHADISNSVFPSGHVAVACSSALGMKLALPERRWLARALVIYSLLVFIATVYGRYHYAADGLASMALSIGVWRLRKS